ncbi:MAG: hypothetical protein JSW05_01905 [Candidatus Thorarchaeota archaeon]|nr:MAG: hypothetical protein JSW05_01905 [Candidatus Thorarchaeota archaeon]
MSVRNLISKLARDIKTSKGAARIDLFGRFGLLVPALASSGIIVLIFTFLWYESAPIMTSPEGGFGIIFNTTWDPNRNLYGIAIFIVGSFMCTMLAIGIAVPLGLTGTGQ